jgi:hypothetical protein
MILPSGLMHRSTPERQADRPRHRLNTGPFPLGATRFRLIQALNALGIYAERTAARLREEQWWARLLVERSLARLREEERARQILEAQRLARLQEERKAAAFLEAQRLVQSRQEERSASLIEQRRFVLLLKEELAFESMTEEQKAAGWLEEQIVFWLSSDECGA